MKMFDKKKNFYFDLRMFSFTCRHGITDFSKLTSLSLTDCVEEFVSINDFFSFLQVRGRWAGRPNLDLVAKKCNLGDWFLIYHLGRNMEPMVYGEFLKEFAKELENSVSTLERKPMLVGS